MYIDISSFVREKARSNAKQRFARRRLGARIGSALPSGIGPKIGTSSSSSGTRTGTLSSGLGTRIATSSSGQGTRIGTSTSDLGTRIGTSRSGFRPHSSKSSLRSYSKVQTKSILKRQINLSQQLLNGREKFNSFFSIKSSQLLWNTNGINSIEFCIELKV